MQQKLRSAGRRIARTVFSTAFALSLALPLLSHGALAAEADLTPDATAIREVQAGGAQVYTCRANEAGALQWALVGPKAILLDDDGSDFGTHSLGPTWSALDGSTITADGAHPLAKVDRPGSIPAVLLTITSSRGAGVLSGVRFVRRADTEGGAPPAGGCDAAHLNTMTAVHYSAVYTFFR